MKKKILSIICWAVLSICILVAYYYGIEKEKWTIINIQKVDADTQTEAQEAFSTAAMTLASGDYEIQVDYSSEKDQKIQISAINDDFSKYVITDTQMKANETTACVSFQITQEEQQKKIETEVIYTGNGSLKVQQIRYLKDGMVFYRVDDKMLSSSLPGASEGEISTPAALLTTYSFSNVPEQKGYAIDMSVFDKSEYICQVTQLGEMGWNYLLYDSSKNPPKDCVSLNGYDNCTVSVYSNGSKETFLPFEVKNLLVKKLVYVAIFVVLILLVMYLFLLFIHKQILISWLQKISIIVTTILAVGVWKFDASATEVISVWFLLATLVAFMNCFTKEYKTSLISNETLISNNSACIAGTIAILFSVITLGLMLTSKEGSVLYRFNSIHKMNLVDYFLVVVSAVLLFLLLNFILQKKTIWIAKHAFNFGKEEIYAFVMFILFLTSSHYSASPLLILLVSYTVYYGIRNLKEWKYSNIYVVIGYIAMTIIWFVANCTVNMFTEDSHHGGAYLDPIYNVFMGSAFTGGETDLYGHYGLFFKPIFAIFGASTLVIGVFMAVICAICAVAACVVIHHMIDSDFMRIVATLMVTICGLDEKLLLQVFPHRALFPLIMMAVTACWMNKRLNIRRQIIGFFICALALVWNTESGVVVCLGWLCFCILTQINDQSYSLKKALLLVLKYIIFFVIIAVVGMLTLTGYNYITAGGDAAKIGNIKSDLGVLLNPDYMIGFHQTIWSWDNGSWTYIMYAMLGAFLFALGKTGLVGKTQKNNKAMVVAVISIEGIGMMTYFINRVEMGWGITIPYITLLMAIGLNYFSKTYFTNNNLGIAGIAKMIARCFLIICTSLYIIILPQQMSNVWNNRVVHDTLSYSQLQEQLDCIRNEVPEDTWCSGPLSGYLYMDLGWDKQLNQGPNTQYLLIFGNADICEEKYRKIKSYQVGDCEYSLYFNPDYIQQ